MTLTDRIRLQGRFLFDDGKYAAGTALVYTTNGTKSFTPFRETDPKLNLYDYVHDSFKFDVRAVGKTEYELISIFERKLARWRSPAAFDLAKYVMEQTIAVDKDLTVFDDPKSNYQGQMDNNKKYHGLGRLESFSEFYEGEFQNGKYHGTGRLITTKSDTFTVVTGYFEDGQYVASSLSENRLQKLFDSEPVEAKTNLDLMSLWKSQGPFDLAAHLKSDHLHIQSRNVSMFDEQDLSNKEYDGASLTLIRTNYYGFDDQNSSVISWHGQYSYFNGRKYTKGIGRYYDGDILIEGDLERFGRVLYSNGTVYVGILPREYSRGLGEQVLKDGTRMSGIWFKQQFQGRIQYPAELKYQQVLNTLD